MNEIVAPQYKIDMTTLNLKSLIQIDSEILLHG